MRKCVNINMSLNILTVFITSANDSNNNRTPVASNYPVVFVESTSVSITYSELANGTENGQMLRLICGDATKPIYIYANQSSGTTVYFKTNITNYTNIGVSSYQGAEFMWKSGHWYALSYMGGPQFR